MTQTDRIDGLQASAAIKAPCRVATTAAITLAGLQTIDGVALAGGDRVLVKDQTDATENGIYVAAPAAWSRAGDFDGARDVVQGTLLTVAAGTTHGGEVFKVTAGDIVFGTTDITFESLGGAFAPPVRILEGGTGAPSAEGALTNLGGTAVGRSVFTAVDAAAARGVLGLGTAAVEAVAAGGSAGLLRADGDGSGLTGVIDHTVRANIVLWTLRTMINGGLSVQTLVDGVADAFVDETGVDTGASIDQTYDAAGDTYHNEGTISQVAQGTGTAIGDMTDATAGNTLAASFDGVQVSIDGVNSSSKRGSVTSAYVGKDWGAGTTRRIVRYKTWDVTNAGYGDDTAEVTLKLFGSDTAPSNPTDGTELHTSGAFNSTVASQPQDFTSGITTTTAYRYHWVAVVPTSAVGHARFGEIEFHDLSTPPDMTLQSQATAAEAQPDEAFVVVWQEDVDSVTLNTDLEAWASRDGGTTWTQITLAQAATLATGRVLTGTADISGQPAGTAMKWRLTTHNNKALRVHGVGLDWG